MIQIFFVNHLVAISSLFNVICSILTECPIIVALCQFQTQLQHLVNNYRDFVINKLVT